VENYIDATRISESPGCGFLGRGGDRGGGGRNMAGGLGVVILTPGGLSSQRRCFRSKLDKRATGGGRTAGGGGGDSRPNRR